MTEKHKGVVRPPRQRGCGDEHQWSQQWPVVKQPYDRPVLIVYGDLRRFSRGDNFPGFDGIAGTVPEA